MTLQLKLPSEHYAEQVMAYREAMLRNGDSLDGCAGLEDTTSFEEWVAFDRRLRERYVEHVTPSTVYLAVREADDQLVDIVQYRSPLTLFLEKHGGHIGYSVHPDERQKGYATEILQRILAVCLAIGESEVLLTCDKRNIASRKTIQNNGGVLIDELEESSGRITQRFRVALQK